MYLLCPGFVRYVHTRQHSEHISQAVESRCQFHLPGQKCPQSEDVTLALLVHVIQRAQTTRCPDILWGRSV